MKRTYSKKTTGQLKNDEKGNILRQCNRIIV